MEKQIKMEYKIRNDNYYLYVLFLTIFNYSLINCDEKTKNNILNIIKEIEKKLIEKKIIEIFKNVNKLIEILNKLNYEKKIWDYIYKDSIEIIKKLFFYNKEVGYIIDEKIEEYSLGIMEIKSYLEDYPYETWYLK